MITGDPDFIATVHFFTPEKGGRTKPLFSGYFSILKFPFSEIRVGGKQKFSSETEIHPGKTTEAEIELLMPDLFSGQLSEGMEFEFGEGPYTLGTGIIKQVLTPALKKN